jgi:23S rRNA (adenine2503-C2)-methyltransferase
MHNIPEALKDDIMKNIHFGSIKIMEEQKSIDGTIKRACELHDGQLIECLLMPYADGRRTACISSQAGCAMRCSFCATGQMGFSRQLTSTEIFEQVQQFAFELKKKGEKLSNVVFMGMVIHSYIHSFLFLLY